MTLPEFTSKTEARVTSDATNVSGLLPLFVADVAQRVPTQIPNYFLIK